MAHPIIQSYLNTLHDLLRVAGTSRETVVREAFKDLLKAWGRSLDLVFVAEYEPEKFMRLDTVVWCAAPALALVV